MKKKTQLFKDIATTFFEENTLYPELTKVRGIGKKKLSKILYLLSMDGSKRVKDLLPLQRSKIYTEFKKQLISSELNKYKLERIDLEKSIASYRGFRHQNKLKLRGQKTKSTGRKKSKRKVKK